MTPYDPSQSQSYTVTTIWVQDVGTGTYILLGEVVSLKDEMIQQQIAVSELKEEPTLEADLPIWVAPLSDFHSTRWHDKPRQKPSTYGHPIAVAIATVNILDGSSQIRRRVGAVHFFRRVPC